MTSLIFKFHDALLLTHNPGWRKFLHVPDWYFEMIGPFCNDNPHLTRQPAVIADLMAPQIEKFSNLLDQFGLKNATYLFQHVNPKACLNLSARAKRIRYQSRLDRQAHPAAPEKPFLMPNIFNYFQVEFHPQLLEKEREVQNFLDQLVPFLPHYNTFSKLVIDTPGPPPLLQYAYLKDDPVPLSATTPRGAEGPNSGQFYFADMAIPPGPATPLPPIGITIIEADGWYLNHPQFLTSRQILFPEPPVFDMSTLNQIPDELTHGTQILGILVAKDGDRDNTSGGDLCRGIAPTLAVRLVSCLTEGTLVSGTDLEAVRYNEAAAVLTAIDITPAGETILIELGTAGALFPLDIQPAVYELLYIADHIGITVVEAAGNGGAVLNTVPAGVNDPLMPRDIRAAALKGPPQDNHSHTHWNAYTNPENRSRIAALARKYGTTVGPRFRTVKDFLDHYQETPSKAILVGATVRGGPDSFTLKPDSSRGDRVKVFAQGDGILTTTIKNEYTAEMGSTSGAAAIVAGIVGLVQQAAMSKGMPTIPPAAMAGWLASQTDRPVVSSGGTGVVYTGIVPSCQEVMRQAGL